MKELIKKIQTQCKGMFGGYDLFGMRELIIEYCEKKGIEVDTPRWNYLVDKIWLSLDREDIERDFESEDDMNNWLGM